MSHAARRMTGAARMILGALLGAAFVVATAAPAAAHTALEASSPKDDGKTDTAPSQVVLEFTEAIRSTRGVSRVIVQGPDGKQYQAGPPQVAGNKLTQTLKPLGEAGRYRIEFRIVASDGHPLVDETRFTLTKPGPALGGTKAVAQLPIVRVAENLDGPSAAPSWAPWAAGVAVVIFASGAIWFGRRVTHGLD